MKRSRDSSFCELASAVMPTEVDLHLLAALGGLQQRAYRRHQLGQALHVFALGVVHLGLPASTLSAHRHTLNPQPA